nr:immunoglobulin heavy chain junction region [Macaca mulatta]
CVRDSFGSGLDSW